MVCEVVSDSECDFVEPPTFSLSGKRKASSDFKLETEVKIPEGRQSKAVPDAIRKQAHAAKCSSKK